jgi:alanine-glyoxylate transaminase/serine-glyoxylate transaminase/serine-pyruvate transaminase
VPVLHPGLSPVSFRAGDRKVKSRKTPVQSWFLDSTCARLLAVGGQHFTTHTAPINPMYGLHESLVMLEEEGLRILAATARCTRSSRPG